LGARAARLARARPRRPPPRGAGLARAAAGRDRPAAARCRDQRRRPPDRAAERRVGARLGRTYRRRPRPPRERCRHLWLAARLRGQYPPTVSTHPIQVALRTGEPQLLPDLQAQAEAMAHDAKHARAIRRIANTSGLVAPLVARGRTLGTLSLGTIEGQPRFDESDLAMAMELARRISLALDNARLFSEAQERAHAAAALEYVDDGVILVDEAG